MNFTQWRNFHKLSQQQVVDGSGVSMNSITKYEKGETMRDDTRAKIESFINSIDGGVYLNQKKDYTPKAMYIDDIWSYIPRTFNYITKDESDILYLHEFEPKINYDHRGWENSGRCCELPINIYFDEYIDWKNCCFKRPYNYWDYIGKVGIFTDDNKPDITVIGKLKDIDMDSEFPFTKENGKSYSKFRPLTEMEKSQLA